MARLSDEEYQKRLDLWKKGFKDSEIARACGVTSASIYQWRKTNGLENNNKDNFNKVSAEEKARIFELHNKGYNNSEIATLIGISKVTVYQYLLKNGYKTSESIEEKVDELSTKEKFFFEYLREKYPNNRKAHLFSLAKFATPHIDICPTAHQKKYLKKIKVPGFKTVHYFDDGEYTLRDEAVKLFVDVNRDLIYCSPQKLRINTSKEIYDLINNQLSDNS